MAEADYFEKTPKKANRWFVAFIVLSVLFGITFSLASFFNWIFFLGAGYSLFMSYFLLPVQPKIFQGRPSRPQASQFNMGNRGGASSMKEEAAQRKKIVIVVISVFFFIMVFIPFLIGVINGAGEESAVNEQQDASYESQDPRDASDSPDYSSQGFIANGNDFFNKQQYDSADKYYDKAIEADPSDMEGYYGKGIVAYYRGNADVANTYFLKAYEGGFRYAWLSWALADMYDKQGQTSRAVELYKESTKLDSTYIDSYKRLAELEPENQAKYLELAQKYASN